jgi:uncharacterized membrane protein
LGVSVGAVDWLRRRGVIYRIWCVLLCWVMMNEMVGFVWNTVFDSFEALFLNITCLLEPKRFHRSGDKVNARTLQ